MSASKEKFGYSHSKDQLQYAWKSQKAGVSPTPSYEYRFKYK